MKGEMPIHHSAQARKINSQIPVDGFIQGFQVTNPQVQETLSRYHVLCYLLGRVGAVPVGRDDNMRDIHLLEAGSGMFGLEIRDDVMRWRGIFNHVMGTARQVFYLASRLENLGPDQRRQLVDMGFDFSEFDTSSAEVLRDFMFISHAGRRSADEKKWYKLDDAAHRESDPGLATDTLLKESGADPVFLDLMRVEMHADHLAEAGEDLRFPNIVDNVLTYTDWTFGQTPNTLAERFEGLRRSQRASPEVLDVLEPCANSFERALKQAIGPHIWHRMAEAGPYVFETDIRSVYCAASTLSLEEVFPDFKPRTELRFTWRSLS